LPFDDGRPAGLPPPPSPHAPPHPLPYFIPLSHPTPLWGGSQQSLLLAAPGPHLRSAALPSAFRRPPRSGARPCLPSGSILCCLLPSLPETAPPPRCPPAVVCFTHARSARRRGTAPFPCLLLPGLVWVDRQPLARLCVPSYIQILPSYSKVCGQRVIDAASPVPFHAHLAALPACPAQLRQRPLPPLCTPPRVLRPLQLIACVTL
jgi:hypothetical protein